jgi:hypothetical protein
MWCPIDVFFIAWFCNFSPCQDARLNVSEIIEAKENKVISQTIGLRDGV